MKTSNSPHHSLSSIVTCAAAVLLMQLPVLAESKTVASFESDECLASWTSVNDGVMGGISKGGFSRSEQGTLIFEGELSLEHNGGFPSIRMKPIELNLSGMSPWL